MPVEVHAHADKSERPANLVKPKTHVPCILPSYSLSQLSELQQKDDTLGTVWEYWRRKVEARRPITRGDISGRLDEGVEAPDGD